jgi:hypothetical protein
MTDLPKCKTCKGERKIPSGLSGGMWGPCTQCANHGVPTGLDLADIKRDVALAERVRGAETIQGFPMTEEIYIRRSDLEPIGEGM